MSKTQSIPMPIGGEYLAGHPSLMPAGKTRLMSNMISKPGRWEPRPAITYDTTSFSAYGLANWDDFTNKVTRLVAQSGDGTTADIYVKGTSGETYGAVVTGPTLSTRTPADSCNYRGQLYMTYGTTSTGLDWAPVALHSYNGTSITQYPIGGETLYSVTITPFGDRLILGHVGASVVNQLGTTTSYDPTGWTANAVAAINITNGSAVTGRIIPTLTTGSTLKKANVYTVAASTSPTYLKFSCAFRSAASGSTAGTTEMPMTLAIYHSQVWVADTVYAAGAIRVPTTSNGYRYRVTVAGTSANPTEPTWPTTLGTTVVDNTATWICDGPESIAYQPITIPSLTDEPNFKRYSVTGTVPALPVSTGVGVEILFGNLSTPTYVAQAIDMSYKDGLTDGVVGKRNWGAQLTVGKFDYPFFNQESSATVTLDLDNDLYWTETADPTSIYGTNFYRLHESPGSVTCAIAAGGRYIVWKRLGMWVFGLTNDPDNPLQLERFFKNYGAPGPRAAVVFEDTVYFASDNEVYRYVPGGEPQPLCGDGMREAMMNQGAQWRAQSVGLTIDESNRNLIVLTQTFPIYVYQIDRKEWSEFSFSTGGTLTSQGVLLVKWNPNTRKVYFLKSSSGGAGVHYVSRMDGSATDADDATHSASIIRTVRFRPLRSLAEGRELNLQGILLHHMTEVSQSGATFTVSAHNMDDGLSHTNSITLPTVTAGLSSPSTPRVATATFIPLRQSGQDLIIALSHTGNGGDGNFTPCLVEAIVQDIGPQRNLSVPTQGSVSLT